jgi:hypothetical protein
MSPKLRLGDINLHQRITLALLTLSKNGWLSFEPYIWNCSLSTDMLPTKLV